MKLVKKIKSGDINMADDEYEMIPHQLLSDLKYDVEALKKKLTQPDNKSNELILEIESLKDSIHELNIVFQKALEETKSEDPLQEITQINTRINDVIKQNETIAQGMIAISDKLEEFMNKNSGLIENKITTPTEAVQGAVNPDVHHTMGPPVPPGPGKIAPPPQAMATANPNLGEPTIDFPPPPPSTSGGKKRLGLFK